jgi:hypothetical protein
MSSRTNASSARASAAHTMRRSGEGASSRARASSTRATVMRRSRRWLVTSSP